MPPYHFSAELARWGPEAEFSRPSRETAEDYCRQIATAHYENFAVASWLLPRHLRQPFCNVYVYCRWADDLADETEPGQTALDLLDWWEGELAAMYTGQARHPVFVALAQTVETFEIPQQPFADLLVAFRRDQVQTRYATFDELLQYCRYSANPVGRLVLYLGRSFNEEHAQLSDQICTGLQLANFWQDVARDWHRGRLYLPLEDCERFKYHINDPAWGMATPQFKQLLAYEVDRAEELLLAGRPLVKLVGRDLRWELDLIVRGGLAVLAGIRRRDYDVWSGRPKVSKLHKLSLVVRAWWAARSESAT